MNFETDFQTDLEWMHRISHRLEKFKIASASSHVYNCRCPICGDSEKNNKKARFYFYTKRQHLNVICHNCGYSRSFYNFLKETYPHEFDEYKRDQIHARVDSFNPTVSPKSSSTPEPRHTSTENTGETKGEKGLCGVTPLSELSDTHEAVAYLQKRGFTRDMMNRLFWSSDFKITANSVSHEPLSKDFPSEPRIVIPFYGEDGSVEMIQGRSLSSSGMRYLSIKSHPDVDKIYGKYEIDRSQTVYCVEGPFDSLFVDNCLATCDSNLTRADADVFLFDNQPRSREIVKLLEKAIDKGYQVVIWPSSPDKKQDINDMILEGMSRQQLMQLIRDNTLSGPMAKLAFMKWRKV